MTGKVYPTPSCVMVYGRLRIIPFWFLPVTVFLARNWTGVAVVVEAGYAAQTAVRSANGRAWRPIGMW